MTDVGLVDLYRDLHRHPELAFAEHRTAKVLSAELERLGFAVRTGFGRTGVVGILERGNGPVILLRAELDALPLAELTGVPFAADRHTTGPAMHACGHDLHICWLIGACRDLARNDCWHGTIIALGQPAEETGEGAAAMLSDGLFDVTPIPDVLATQHVGPAPVGSFATATGPMLAGSDTVDIVFTAPRDRDRLADRADPARVSARYVSRLPTSAAGSDGLPVATIAVLAIAAGDPIRRQLITPDTATVRLAVRSATPAAREQIKTALEGLARGEAADAGAPQPSFAWDVEIPPVINDPAVTDRVMDAMRRSLGDSAVQPIPPSHNSDDFGRLASAVGRPSIYSYLGGGARPDWERAIATGDRTKIIGNHSPRFLPSAGALEFGVRSWLITVTELLRARSDG